MTFDDYEDALIEETPERVSPFREKASQLIVGDCFKMLAWKEEIIWQVVKINYDWNVVKAVKWEDRHQCPTIHVFDFGCDIVRYKIK